MGYCFCQGGWGDQWGRHLSVLLFCQGGRGDQWGRHGLSEAVWGVGTVWERSSSSATRESWSTKESVYQMV